MPYRRNQARGDVLGLVAHSETFCHTQCVVNSPRRIAIKLPWGAEGALVGVDKAGVAAADYDEVLSMLSESRGRKGGVCNQGSDVAGIC
jgi:hypothetical protein